MSKIIAIALISAFLCVYLRQIQSEYFTLALLSSGIIICITLISYVGQALNFINEILYNSSIDSELIKILFKIVSIAYVSEFIASTIEDMGLKSISDKVVLSGKILIFITSTPILYAVFNLLKGLII